MTRRFCSTVLLATLCLLSLPLARGAEPLGGKLVSTGSDTLGPLSAMWAQDLMRRHPDVNVQLRAIGSSAAPTALVQGTADIGPMSRPMSAAERRAFLARYGYEATAVPVAFDALAVFVHRDNPLRSLTRRSVDALFSANRRCGAVAALTDWDGLDLGERWAGRPVVRYGRGAASGTYGYFRRELLCGGDFAPGVNRLIGSAAVVSAVGNDRESIGYASAGFVNGDVKRVLIRNARGETLALTRELLLYINRPPGAALPPLLAAYLELVLSAAGQDRVGVAGYSPLPAAQRETQRRRLGLAGS